MILTEPTTPLVFHAQPGGTFSFVGCFMNQYPKQILTITQQVQTYVDAGMIVTSVEDVEKEMRAQIELAMKYIDNVTHITDHCMWTMRPDLKELAIRVAQDYGLRYQGQGDYDAQIGIQSLPMGFGRGPRAARLLEALKKMEKGKTYWTISISKNLL